MSWHKKIPGTLLIAAAGILFILAASTYLIVQTRAFNQFVLEKVIQNAQEATGARVEIKRVEIHWRTLGIDFYDFVVYGNGGASQPPLLRGDHLGIGLRIISILKRKIDIAEIVLDRPVLNVRVNTKGETNLPKPPSTSSTPDRVGTAFDMAIGHVRLNSGRFDYNDQQIPVSADLQDFHAESSFGPLTRAYQGSLSYSHGRIVAKSVNPFEHSARLNFTATPSEFDLDPVVLVTGNSRLIARAKLTHYTNLNMEGSYEAVVFMRDIAAITNNPSLPPGQVAIAGSLRYQNVPGTTLMDGLGVDGHLSSPQLGLRAGQFVTTARAVRGRFSLEKGNLRIPDLEADLLEGHLRADGEVLGFAGRSAVRVSASIKDVSLESVSAVLPRSYDRLHFKGRANVDVQASWANSIQNIAAHFRTTIAAPADGQSSKTGIPVHGILDIGYDGAHDTASVGQSHLQTGSTQISLAGTVSKQSKLTVQADTSDLREVSALVSEISAATASPSGSTSHSTPWDIRGSAHFAGQVSGAARNPRLQGRLSARNVEVEGSRWRSIQTSVELASAGVALQNGMLESAARGQLSFSARAGLNHWSLTPGSPLSVQAIGTDLSLADLERLAKQGYPVDGTVSASISIGGTKQDPSGRGSVQIARASAWSEPVNKLAMNFEAGGHSIKSTVELQLPAGRVTADLAFSPQTEEYDVIADTEGLKLDQIRAVQARDLGVAGLLKASVRGQGSFKNPNLSANLSMSQLLFRHQSISSVEARLNLERRHATVTLHSVIAQGDVEAKGDLELAGDYDTTATIDVRALPLGALLASYLPASQPNLQGQTEVHADLHGPLKDLARVQAHIKIPTFSLAYQSVSIALARPLRLDYLEGIATLQETELKGTGTDVVLRGVIPVKSRATTFNIVANGAIDLSVLQGLTRGVKSSGRIELQIDGRGDLKHPVMQGQVRIENAYFSSDSSPLGIDGVNGQLNVSGNRFEINGLTGNVGGGTVSVQGFMIYGSQPNFNLGLQATSVRLRYPEGLRSILNCDLHLNGTTLDSILSGRVLVERLSFTQQFDLANFATQFTSSVASTSPSLLEQNVRLNVAIQSSENLNLTSSQLSMQGAANVNLTGTLANPVILGRVNLTGGDIFFLGKRYEVRNGTIEFSNPVRTEPVVNLYVHTTAQQYDITLNFVGPLDRLRTNYVSNPPLPAADIINLLARGKTAEESATTNTPASVGAESVVAQGVASQVSGQIQKLAGISQLTIDPLAGSNPTNPGSQVAIQKRVTGNILLTFGTDVTSTQATSIQLQYRMGRQTSVSVLRDQNGGYAVDIRLHKTF